MALDKTKAHCAVGRLGRIASHQLVRRGRRAIDMTLSPSDFDSFTRHPAVVAFVSVSLGTWLFGHFSYLRSRRDTRREKSIAFLDETAKPLNTVLTSLFRCTRSQKLPPDDSLLVAINPLFQQRLAVRIKGEAYLQTPKFSKDYDDVVFEIDRIALRVSKPNPDFKQLEADTEAIWQRTRALLSNALSNALLH
jgi:hypothetical protein